ncbi:MAG: GNAT family N-acetyltransferase [Motilibacteraceae bacterium]
MHLRPYEPADLDGLLSLTIDTFGPFYEQSVRSLVGERIFQHQHGDWREDYRREVPTLHDPAQHRHVLLAVEAVQAVEAVDADRIVGFVAWSVLPERRHGQITHLAVDQGHRRHGVAGELFDAALAAMRADGVDVVALGTGGEWFHEPARAFYESKGMVAVPGVYYFTEL